MSTALQITILLTYALFLFEIFVVPIPGARSTAKKIAWLKASSAGRSDVLWTAMGVIGGVFLFVPPPVLVFLPGKLLPGLFRPLELPPDVHTVALVLLLAGHAVMLAATFSLRPHLRRFEKTGKLQLKTDGIFGWCRHPIQAGFLLVLAGILLAVPAPAVLFGAALFVAFSHRRILQEEAFLTALFGEEYRAYRQRAGRYLPKICQCRQLRTQ